ncbi:MAG: hypothetical protein WAW85_07940 [Gordonia sp. (in: high G+C Gram-positive bacteria)]|uniref:hypothetical protein n=1 Tax=Gordonia sp. (in: high G+C Gram-positive bacteria) TaxID=84139 RepID=UPI003BB79AC0
MSDYQDLALFLLPAEVEAQERAAKRAEWNSHFEQVEWIAPYDCADGTPAGSRRIGIRCPACGAVEVSGFVLALNHGLDPGVPKPAGFTRCAKML